MYSLLIYAFIICNTSFTITEWSMWASVSCHWIIKWWLMSSAWWTVQCSGGPGRLPFCCRASCLLVSMSCRVAARFLGRLPVLLAASRGLCWIRGSRQRTRIKCQQFCEGVEIIIWILGTILKEKLWFKTQVEVDGLLKRKDVPTFELVLRPSVAAPCCDLGWWRHRPGSLSSLERNTWGRKHTKSMKRLRLGSADEKVWWQSDCFTTMLEVQMKSTMDELQAPAGKQWLKALLALWYKCYWTLMVK